MVTSMLNAKKFSTANQVYRVLFDIERDETDENIKYDVLRYGNQYIIRVTEDDEVIGYL
jgi:hypothetical protein